MSDKSQLTSDVDNMTNQVKASIEQATDSAPRRRSSLWKEFQSGSVLASQRDITGTRSGDSTGFSTCAAKFEDTFGGSALTETGFTEAPTDPKYRRQTIDLSEDALRQMT